ncbi:poly(U)-specific endoribonuclease-like isoform X2 [Anneissia japonica]|uniref:poly(U)-specific endoribonuclease-like isoform X2 n=1 Tax=Anneissia japonica TaxID=1529436 RepID=UPI0014257C97|nr:poly(U)-specific endoribonuclease-like isoform X2 [Anneissia japonica]
MKYVNILLLFACIYDAVLLSRADSCSGRCDSGFSNSYDCQCNTQCATYGDCCSDYQLECLGSGPVPVTSADLTTLANTLWSVDGNRASSSQFTVNKQTKLSSSSNTVDKSSSPLLSYVDGALLKKDTYAKFISLLDNFIASTGRNEVFTSTETKEKDAFMSAIMKTSVMTETYNFLYSKGYVLSLEDFQYKMEEMWFKAYGRSSSSDSSGFEHVFVGEQKSTSVSGFHNWIQLYHEEQSGDLNYYGYTKDASVTIILSNEITVQLKV